MEKRMYLDVDEGETRCVKKRKRRKRKKVCAVSVSVCHSKIKI
jgi:hypothetical protein